MTCNAQADMYTLQTEAFEKDAEKENTYSLRGGKHRIGLMECNECDGCRFKETCVLAYGSKMIHEKALSQNSLR